MRGSNRRSHLCQQVRLIDFLGHVISSEEVEVMMVSLSLRVNQYCDYFVTTFNVILGYRVNNNGPLYSL